MTSKERVLSALSLTQPDYVPVAPDLYEMVPIRLSQKDSWHIFVYNDPPIWKARADACGYYGVDALIPLFVPFEKQNVCIVSKTDDKVITRDFYENDGKRSWAEYVIVYSRNDPSAYVKASALGMPSEPDDYEIVNSNYSKFGKEYFQDAVEYLGDGGVIMPVVGLPCLDHDPQSMYDYYDNHDRLVKKLNKRGEDMMRQAEEILSWQPDVLMIGNSGLMLFNPPEIFRELCLSWMQKVTKLAKQHGVLTHMHCCGSERALVEIAANETDLNGIEPLEVPPMGDCDLKEIKQKFGKKLALKGNLHTTDIMLFGTVAQVEDACKRAIDDAAAGGGFILSTGDQTPRDVPDENILAMKRIAQEYGRY